MLDFNSLMYVYYSRHFHQCLLLRTHRLRQLSWDHYKKQYALRIAGGKIGGGADKDKNKEAWNKAKMAFYKYRRYQGKPVYGAGKGQNPNMPDSGMRHLPAPPGAMEKARKRQKDLAAYKDRTK